MTPDVQLVEELVRRLPAFEDLYESHVFNEDGVLPHVFFWDVTQETVASFLGDEDPPDWRATVGFLEEQFGAAEPKAREVVVTSFLDYLPFPGQPGGDLTRYLGPQLTGKLAELRPGLTF
ncbi:hypothetical protein [Actinoallomurus iriomotensis]|uniref:Uncharacterized protein n=1 Tax=Actinoallomurus iriomotensis TaxID=478107 RepID=A0A9W6SEK9_9ACTN|nr:hypothetical protein [Actinoallomurus iriomotensis]GLY91330.1 hypothetical protein Airi02_092590 [Actinoallomurus iriomotensis]